MREQTVAFAEAKDGKKKKGGDEKASEEPAEAAEATAEATPEPDAKAEPEAVEAKVDAPAEPAKPVEPEPEPVRARTETIAMPPEAIGKPPPVPTVAPAPVPVVAGAVESPAHMPIPKDVPGGSPDDAAPPPGRVPPGDSRSLRKGSEFALVYRVGTFVISRFGALGKRGQWRVVEYPTSSFASHSYAKECSRFVSDGFSDYRD